MTELTTDEAPDNYAWVAANYDTTVKKDSETALKQSFYEIGTVSEAATITFTNTRKTRKVTVIKKVVGTGGDFDFTALLQNDSRAIANFKLAEGYITDSTGSKAFSLLSIHGDGQKEVVFTVPYGSDFRVSNHRMRVRLTWNIPEGTRNASTGPETETWRTLLYLKRLDLREAIHRF